MLRPVPLDDEDEEPSKVPRTPEELSPPWRKPEPPTTMPEESQQKPKPPTTILQVDHEPVPLPLGLSRADRKKARSDIRRRAHQAGLPAPKTFNPSGYLDMPPICNRVAAKWGQPPLPCQCKEEWPRFLSQAVPIGQARIPPY